MNTAIILRLLVAAGILSNIFNTGNQNNQQQYAANYQSENTVRTQKATEAKWQQHLQTLPEKEEEKRHHEHRDAEVHSFCFERIRKAKCGFSLRCTFAKTLLVLTYFALLAMMLNHTENTQAVHKHTENYKTINNHVVPKDVAIFWQQNTAGKISR